jgi:5-methyltetrahydropteroyltriglutamate--homocysteine methyltransferase
VVQDFVRCCLENKPPGPGYPGPCTLGGMRRSAGRIITTHVGSLPRPEPLLDRMKDGEHGPEMDGAIAQAVAAAVDQQVRHGVDVVTDGEQGKTGFFAYIGERLTGFEPRPGARGEVWSAEISAFPEYYAEYFRRAMVGGSVVTPQPLVCVGPVAYRGHEAVARDIANLKAAMARYPDAEAFLPATAPSGLSIMTGSAEGANEYYPSYAEYLFAVADALREEYRAIVDAGLLLQVDDPSLTDILGDARLSPAEASERADLFVEATNRALQGIPPDRVRFHTCYGINEGPRVHDVGLAVVIPWMLKVRAAGLSFEGANARHEHEYHAWETVRLPGDRVLLPGVITHASNIVEHPELIAERITRYAAIVGRENVIASTDCGFSSQASYRPEVDPRVMWAKFDALAEGARLASERLWT